MKHFMLNINQEYIVPWHYIFFRNIRNLTFRPALLLLTTDNRRECKCHQSSALKKKMKEPLNGDV